MAFVKYFRVPICLYIYPRLQYSKFWQILAQLFASIIILLITTRNRRGVVVEGLQYYLQYFSLVKVGRAERHFWGIYTQRGSLIQNSRKKEGEIFRHNSLRTRGVRLEDIKILGEMSFIHYSRKKTRAGGVWK